ncbi:hypothetical protein ACHAWF_010794 [Thalassiosira exigua]
MTSARKRRQTQERAVAATEGVSITTTSHRFRPAGGDHHGLGLRRNGVCFFVFVMSIFLFWAYQQHRYSTARSTATGCATSTQSATEHVGLEYERAARESFQFFRDIHEREWSLLKERASSVRPNQCPYCLGGNNANAWFQNHYEPEFSCRHERRIGSLGDGGKWVCDPHRLRDKDDCLVYSVGSNNDFSFEAGIREGAGANCEIHTFDPANYKTKALENGVHYHMWGIDGVARTDERGRKFKTLRQTVEELGHLNRTIDVFKIDCEGCELSSFGTWVNEEEIGVRLQQVLVEVHGVRVKKDDGTTQEKVHQPQTNYFFEGMHENGYVIFHKEPNIHFWRYTPCYEYAFIKLSKEFFTGKK